MPVKCALLTGAVALALIAPDVAGAAHAGPPPASFYAVGPVPAAAPGTVVRKWRIRSPSTFAARVVLFHSRDRRGRDVVESGIVALPTGKPPRGGFPLVVFAHGTTGFTDASAPSRTGDTGSPYTIGDVFDRFAAHGWAVALPDYEGLGTAGPPAYDVGVSAAHSVLDAARAARRLGRGAVSRRLGLIGHSQGGHAVLWAGQLARRYAPELRLRAVIASSPGADIAGIAAHREDTPETTIGVLGALGAWHAYYHAPLDELLTDAGRTAAAQVFADHADAVDLSRPVFAPTFSTRVAPWGALVRSNTPGATPIPAPTLILVGTADRQVPAETTLAFAHRLQRRGDDVRLGVVAGADHYGALSRTSARWMALLRARLARR